MVGDRFKYVYSILLLLVSVGWGSFCVWITYKAVMERLTIDIIAAAGASVLLGALIKMLGDVNQYWFRKALKKE
jgi:hypothetical protein